MQTEFTCGIYTASFNLVGSPKWFVKVNEYPIGIVDVNGVLITFTEHSPHLSQNDLLEILILMNNIKRQYKQLQTNS
jgi:hypothetical protein